MRISLPPIDKNLSFHPANLLQNLSLISTKTSFFYFPIKEGRPKYLPHLESCIGAKYTITSFFFSSSVLALKKTKDLSILIFWPEASSYRRRISISCWHSWLLALQKSRLSSTKKRWVILGQPLQMDKPLINWFLTALPMREEKPYAQSKNK